MSKFNQSAGLPVSATSGAAPSSSQARKRAPRQAVATSKLSESAWALEYQAGKLAGVRTASELLRRVRGTKEPSELHRAVLGVLDALRDAGKAIGGSDEHLQASVAANEVCSIMAELVVFGAQYSPLEEFLTARLVAAEREGAGVVKFVTEKRHAFVQRMRNGKDRKARERLGMPLPAGVCTEAAQ
jgi:hypothetical protein